MDSFINGKKPKRWIAPEIITPEAEHELEEYPVVFRQVLFSRGLDTTEKAHEFLQNSMAEHNPLLMKGMEEAAEIIKTSILMGNPIVVYGDYDVDGVTATALMVQVIRELGGVVMEYIPNRFDEGYGLNLDAINELHHQNVSLIITVDCGIRSVKEAELARELGIKLIITDHHHPLETIPGADVVICPRQEGDDYPYKDLAGVGIAYKVARILFGKFGKDPKEAERWLDLVALGTVSDGAPLTGENRLLVKLGLDSINTNTRTGLYSLLAVSGMISTDSKPIKPKKVTAGDIGFKLGPRLNAAGRMESAMKALHLLMSDDIQNTGLLAQELQQQNNMRQENTLKNQQNAEAKLSDIENLPMLIAFGSEEEFHSGIVGLVAARLVESHYRPAIVGVIGEETTRASCRSIDEFHITKALDECADLLVRHGGHSKAAGFTVSNENREILKERLLEIASRQLNPDELVPAIHYDAEAQLDDLKIDVYRLLEQMEPTGNENPKPVFLTKNLKVIRKSLIGTEKNHLRMTVRNENGLTIDAIGFRMGTWYEEMPEKVDILYHFELNVYKDRESFQLNLCDIRPSEV